MLTVEEVGGKDEFRRFVELPFALFGDEPRWAPPVMAYERARLDPRTNPQLDDGTRYLLARRRGHIVGRLLSLRDGTFGCFDGADEAVGVALLDAIGPAGCGPVGIGEELGGVLVAGFDVAGVTGRQWHPPWYSAALEAAGLRRVEERPMWRLAAAETGAVVGDGGGRPPVTAGPYGDSRLVLPGVAAVPDLAPALRGARPRRAWTLARQARRADWETCTVVRLEAEPAELVPRILAAAARSGYQWVIAPWAPDDRPPETVHATYGR